MNRVTQIPAAADPQMRVDILLLKLGEAAAHWAEKLLWQKAGIPLNLWDTPEGVRAVIEPKIQELDLARPLSPMMLAERAGWVAKPKRIRKAG
jgi:hypothetical protein